MYNKITELIQFLSRNSFDPKTNFDLGIEYEKLGQTASAVGFYLRAAEYGYKVDMELTYKSILKIGLCLEAQSQRDFSCSNSFLQAISYMPERPEAYYFLGRFYERNGSWQEAYTQYSLALKYSDKYLMSDIEYYGHHAVKIGLGTAAYYIGRINHSREIFMSLLQDKNLPEKYRDQVATDAGNIGLKFDKIAIVLPVRNNNSYRAERLKTCITSWRQQTEGKSDIHIIIDDDELEQFEFLKEYDFVTVHIRPNMKLIPKINSVAPTLAKVYKYLAFVGDDIIFRTPWESRIIEYLSSIPAGMAWTNTLDRGDDNLLATHPIITSNMVNALGFYGCPAINHSYFDNFWQDITNDIGYNKYFRDIIWDHKRDGYVPDNMYWHIVQTQNDDMLLYNQYKETKYQEDLNKIRAII